MTGDTDLDTAVGSADREASEQRLSTADGRVDIDRTFPDVTGHVVSDEWFQVHPPGSARVEGPRA